MSFWASMTFSKNHFCCSICLNLSQNIRHGGRSSPRKQHERFIAASKRGCVGSVSELVGDSVVDVNHIWHDGKSALFHAINQQHVPIVETLLSHHANANLASFCTYHRDHSGVQLISCDEPPIVTAARVGNAGIVKMLLDAGANPDSQTACHTHLSGLVVKDRAALHFACDEVNLEIVKLLLDRDADVNVEDKQGELPMHRAVRCRNCPEQTQILQLLCEHGSDVNLANRIGCSPLYLATFYGCVYNMEILLLYGANPNTICSRGNSYGSALHIAALKDRKSLAEKLITHGTQLDLKNNQQSTPLYLNICANNRSTVAPLLIYHGADMSGKDKFHYTLLALCIRNMHLECETLARQMVFAGYDLRRDLWLEPPWMVNSNDRNDHENNDANNDDVDDVIPDVPIAAGRVAALCDWLRARQCSAMDLSDLCRITIRRTLSQHTQGESIVANINSLPLPPSIKDFVAMKDFF